MLKVEFKYYNMESRKSELKMLNTKITKWKYGFDKTKILLTDSWIAAAILQ